MAAVPLFAWPRLPEPADMTDAEIHAEIARLRYTANEITEVAVDVDHCRRSLAILRDGVRRDARTR